MSLFMESTESLASPSFLQNLEIQRSSNCCLLEVGAHETRKHDKLNFSANFLKAADIYLCENIKTKERKTRELHGQKTTLYKQIC